MFAILRMRDKFFLRSATACAVCLPEAGDDVKKITFMKHLAVHGYRKYFRSFKKKKVSPCICAFNVFSVYGNLQSKMSCPYIL